MKHILTIAVALLGILPTIRAEETENPFKKAKVGDWAEYKMSTAVNGMKIDALMKMTVSAISDKEATMKTTAIVNGMEFPAGESKIDLTKPYDPTSAANLPKDTEAKVDKIADGKEKIKIGSKEYDCTWTKIKMKGKANGTEFDSEVKVWLSKDVPLSGMVKMEMKSKLADVTMELAGTGSKK